MKLLVSLVQSYAQRRERSDYGSNDVELKMYLELSLNALYKLILTLSDGEKISDQNVEQIRAAVSVLVECAISELFAMYRCRGNSNTEYPILKIILAFIHRTLCCYDILKYLDGLVDLCAESGVGLQFLYSKNVVPGCMQLHAKKGFKCFCYEANQDVANTGHYETYLIYCMQFSFNLMEGTLSKSVRVHDSAKQYEIGWFHEVRLF